MADMSIYRKPKAGDFAAALAGNGDAGRYVGAAFEEGLDWGTLRFAEREFVRLREMGAMKAKMQDPFSPMSEKQWRESDYFRHDVPYKEGMSMLDAAVNANMHDKRVYRDAVMNNYTGSFKGTMSFLGNMGGALIDPVNLIPVGELAMGAKALATGGKAGYRAFKAAKAAKALSLGQKARMGALDAMIATAASEPFVVASMKDEGAAVGWNDVIMDVMAGAAIGATIGAGSHYLQNRKNPVKEKDSARSAFEHTLAVYDQTGSFHDVDVNRVADFGQTFNESAREPFSRRVRNMFKDLNLSSPREFAESLRDGPLREIRKAATDFMNQVNERIDRDSFVFDDPDVASWRGVNDEVAVPELPPTPKESSAEWKAVNDEVAEIKPRKSEKYRAKFNKAMTDIGSLLTNATEASLAKAKKLLNEARSHFEKITDVEVDTVWEAGTNVRQKAIGDKKRTKVKIVESAKKTFDEIDEKIEMIREQIKSGRDAMANVKVKTTSLKYATQFLANFEKYKNNFIVYDKINKELMIVDASKDPIRPGKRYQFIAEGRQDAWRLAHAMDRGYFSKQDADRMWDMHRRQYRTQYADLTPGATDNAEIHSSRGEDGIYRQGYVEEGGMDSFVPKQDRVGSRNVQTGDRGIIKRDGKWIAVQVGEQGKVKGEKGGYHAVNLETGERVWLDAKEPISILDSREFNDDGVRVLKEDWIEQFREVQKLADKKYGGDTKRVTNADLAEIQYKLARYRKNPSVPNHFEARTKRFESMNNARAATMQELNQEFGMMRHEEILDYVEHLEQQRDALYEQIAGLEKGDVNGARSLTQKLDNFDNVIEAAYRHLDERTNMDADGNMHYTGYDPIRNFKAPTQTDAPKVRKPASSEEVVDGWLKKGEASEEDVAKSIDEVYEGGKENVDVLDEASSREIIETEDKAKFAKETLDSIMGEC